MVFKAILYTIFLLVSYLFICFFLYLPVSYENKVYEEGIDSDYLKLGKNIKSVMEPRVLKLNVDSSATKMDRFFIGDFSFKLPVRDPSILTIPHVRALGKKILYGFSLHDYSGVELLRIEYSGKKTFRLEDKMDDLFSFEMSKNVLLKKKPLTIYNDVFSKSIKFNKTSFLDLVKNPKFTLDSPIYNFFLLKQREYYGIDKSSYFIKEKNIYGKTLEDDESSATDYLEFYERGKLYMFKLTYSSWRESSSRYKNIILSSLRREKSSETIAIENYNTFLSNPYGKRSELKNMIYLFSAWSTNFGDTRYLKAMINTLERAKKFDSPLLKELYDFSIIKFGQTFSIRDEITKKYDSSKVRLKRELKKEAELNDDDVSEVMEYREDIEQIDSGEEFLDQNLDIDSTEVILE